MTARPVTRTSEAERGSVLVMVTLWMPVVVLMASFVINVGHWFEHKRHLQLQADAAALAGGDMFAACFNSGGGDTAIFNEGTKYAGSTGRYNGTAYGTPLYNTQVGGTHKGPISVLYQSPSYADGTNKGDGTETQAPCETPSFMFDVKATESNLPWFLGGGKVVHAINAHARVQLRALGDTNPSLPLAVPDINPRQVGVTFVNEAGGAALSGCSGPTHVTGTPCTFLLTKGTPANGLNMWSGLETVTLPSAPAKVGIRVGVGGQVGTCANVGSTRTYSCYDGSTTTAGLTMIRDYAVGAPPPPVAPSNMSPPVLDGIWPNSCSGNGAFFFLASGTCASGVTAELNYGTGSTQPPATYFIRATAGGTTADLHPVSYDAARNAWIWTTAATPPFALAAQAGAQGISLSWEVQDTTKNIGGACNTRNNNPCKANFANAPQQRFYSGLDTPDTGSGPIRSMQVTGGPDINGPASLIPGSYTLTVTLGLAGNYSVNKPCKPPPSGGSYTCFTYDPVNDVGPDRAVLLRLKQDRGPNTFTIDCGGGNIRTMIENGCANRYSINAADICPDVGTPPDPPDCVPVQTGAATGQIRQGMNTRFAPGGNCLPNNYPTIVPGDKRVVIVMITDFSAFEGGGNTTVPVVTYGAFYVVGWDGAPGGCDNEPYSHTGLGGSSGNGDVWGHFIKYVDTNGRPGPGLCDPSGLLPCVPMLTQ
jgi:hypothetical protein